MVVMCEMVLCLFDYVVSEDMCLIFVKGGDYSLFDFCSFDFIV